MYDPNLPLPATHLSTAHLVPMGGAASSAADSGMMPPPVPGAEGMPFGVPSSAMAARSPSPTAIALRRRLDVTSSQMSGLRSETAKCYTNWHSGVENVAKKARGQLFTLRSDYERLLRETEQRARDNAAAELSSQRVQMDLAEQRAIQTEVNRFQHWEQQVQANSALWTQNLVAQTQQDAQLEINRLYTEIQTQRMTSLNLKT